MKTTRLVGTGPTRWACGGLLLAAALARAGAEPAAGPELTPPDADKPVAKAEDSRPREVDWRDDYAKARAEASAKGRPLVIDLTTDNCFWCNQLDARTFKDPEVVRLLNQRCVPLKVDCGKQPFLAEALRVTSFPTLVYAAPDGKILGYQEGFLEAPALKEQLGKLLAAVTTPDWMARDFEEAEKALARADYGRALGLLKNVVEDGKDRPVQGKARRLLEEVEKQAGERCREARRLADRGRTAEAIEAVNDLGRAFPGTLAAREGKQLLVTLTGRKGADASAEKARRARELLERAREDYRAQQFLCCLDRCEQLALTYADLPEGAQGAELAAEIKANPEWAKKACDLLGERLCNLYLALADTWLKKGQPQQAIFYLERIIQTFPNTRHAESASARLSQLRGSPAPKAALKRTSGS
jgi:tetratricopeptide (TPR) repeat protein